MKAAETQERGVGEVTRKEEASCKSNYSFLHPRSLPFSSHKAKYKKKKQQERRKTLELEWGPIKVVVKVSNPPQIAIR